MKKAKTTSNLSPLAEDIVSGFKELQAERDGKITLRRTAIEEPDPVSVTPEFVLAVRNSMNMSRAVFARNLHVPVRTVERWEQGRSAVSGPAALLVMLAANYPDTLKRIERAVENRPGRAKVKRV